MIYNRAYLAFRMNNLYTNTEDFDEMPIADKVKRFTWFPVYNSPSNGLKPRLGAFLRFPF